MNTTKTFDKLVTALDDGAPRYIDCAGGARSGKTYAILQLLYLLAEADATPTITSVVSETLPHLKRGAIRDWQAILQDHGVWSEAAWNKSDCVYTLPNGSRVEFFSADQPGKVLGPARDRLFINEAINIGWETFRQLDIRTREWVIFDYNPAYAFWAHEQIQPSPKARSIVSTYLDNSFLSPEQVAAIEDQKSDARWWRVYGEGKVGQRTGTIYDFDLVDAMPTNPSLIEVLGLDFGFTNDPTALVRLLLDTDAKAIYCEQLLYGTRFLPSAIIERLRECGIRPQLPIYADSAQPATIEEIRRAGFNCRPCYKGTRKAEQIAQLQGWHLHFTKASVDVIAEARGYAWQTDKDGRELNGPSPFNDHAMDALRYGAFTHLHTYGQSGRYSFAIL
ncbi:MAG: terminase large subunit [Oscillospiraceae bacterium]|nr:terminase large subunit [Oscillospiraceae bacterium]